VNTPSLGLLGDVFDDGTLESFSLLENIIDGLVGDLMTYNSAG